MSAKLHHFLHDESAAVTVDWTVLSAAAVGMALATVAVLQDGIDGLVGTVDSELRSQQMSDSFVLYLSGHYEDALAEGLLSSEDAEYYFEYANDLMNHEVIEGLELGIQMMEDGELTQDDLPLLLSLGSVAYQRNIVDDDVLDHYFGLAGNSEPAYLSYF